MKKLLPLFLLIPFHLVTMAQIHVGAGQKYLTIYAATHIRAVHPGDTIYVHGGVYTDKGQVFDSLIGTSSHWIVIRPYLNDSVSIHVTYTFQHAQYLKISGFNFYGNDPAQTANVFHLLFIDYAYNCFNANHDVIIENCKFTDLNNAGKGSTGAMLKIDGTDHFKVINCLFRNGTNITDGISLNADRNGIVSNCRFENMPGDGSHCKGGSKLIKYQANLFINCIADGLDIGGDTGPAFFCPLGADWEADSILVNSNIFIGGKTGIRLSSCHNSLIINNSCFKTTSFAFRTLNASSNPIYLENNFVFNNIFSTYSANHIYMNASSPYNYSTHYFLNNLFHDYKNADPSSISWSEMTGVNVSGSIIGNPLFSDTLKRDFSLKPGSPAIEAGYVQTEPITDYFGKNFSATKPSIGAIEYVATSLSDERNGNNDLLIFPVPCTDEMNIWWKGRGNILKIELVNTLGQIIYSQKAISNKVKIYCSGQRKGIYHVLLYINDGNTFSRNIFIERTIY